jgi:hypothetical protein
MKLDVVLAEPTQPRGPFITYGHADALAYGHADAGAYGHADALAYGLADALTYGLADAFAHKGAGSWTDAFADAGAHGVHDVPVG